MTDRDAFMRFYRTIRHTCQSATIPQNLENRDGQKTWPNTYVQKKVDLWKCWYTFNLILLYIISISIISTKDPLDDFEFGR